MKYYNKTDERGLIKLYERYFFSRKEICDIKHLPHCQIFRAFDGEAGERPFCSCGLIHDIDTTAYNIPYFVIYPEYNNDYYYQDTGKRLENHVPNEEQQEEMERMLYEVFGPPSMREPESFMEEADELRELIVKVDTKGKWKIALERIDKWCADEINRHQLSPHYVYPPADNNQ